MLFPTFAFVIFFAAVFAASWSLCQRPLADKILLVLASYAFYAAWDWRFCGLLAASSWGNYWIALQMPAAKPSTRKGWLWVGVLGNLGLLGYFKYAGFFALNMDALCHSLHITPFIPLVQMVLPVGISFFTFHGISYIVDVYRQEIPPSRNPVDIFLYISFFPHLIAGPIVRAAYFLPQLSQPRDPDHIPFHAAMVLICAGVCKKVWFAELVGTDLVDPVFLDPTSYTAGHLWLAMYGYAVQIFCDFSAYTDIATGVAALFGYRFPPNFHRPYGATSLRGFWTRWHMSLSAWLRDYLYIPLGGSRFGTLRTCRNLVVTMVLGGLWHGAAWTFVAWGMLHGGILSFERLLGPQGPLRRAWTPLTKHPRVLALLGWCWTFHVVCFGWILFRSTDIHAAWEYILGLWPHGGESTGYPCLAIGVVGLALMMHAPWPDVGKIANWLTPVPVPVLAVLAAIAVVWISCWGPAGVPPFIYFAF